MLANWGEKSQILTIFLGFSSKNCLLDPREGHDLQLTKLSAVHKKIISHDYFIEDFPYNYYERRYIVWLDQLRAISTGVFGLLADAMRLSSKDLIY